MVLITRHGLSLLTLTLATLAAAPATLAGVVVVENRASGRVEFTLHRPDGTETALTLPSGELLPLRIESPSVFAIMSNGQPRRYRLAANGVYYFVEREGAIDCVALNLPGYDGSEKPRSQPPAKHPSASEKVVAIPVIILVDDEEPTVQAVWEKKLRARLTTASDIFERHCGVRFEVAAVGMWTADKSLHDFAASVAEFEQKVRPEPARVAVGFTGRYRWTPGENHLGGTRGPLGRHVLVRDALHDMSEPERLEVLVHELGHFLGAVHVAGRSSVMRPTLGDRQSRARRFQIEFDAPNTLAMCLVVDALRRGPIFSLRQLSPEARAVLHGVYVWSAKTLPTDPAAKQYLDLLGPTQ
jgi:hypothetical protein